MIKEIKSYLKDILMNITGIPESYVYLSLKDENQYKFAPWVSILTKKSDIKIEWQKERKEEDNNKFYVVEKKYTKTIPIIVAFGATTEEEADSWVEMFLERLDKDIVVNNISVKIEPVSIEYSDQESLMTSAYIAALIVNFTHGIYTQTSFDKISNIEEEIEYKK